MCCALERVKPRDHTRNLIVLPTIKLLAFITVDVLSVLVESKADRTVLLIEKSLPSKITQFLFGQTTTAHGIAATSTQHLPFQHRFRNN